MPNPFLDKSLEDLRDMVLRGELSDQNLDNLAAQYCGVEVTRLSYGWIIDGPTSDWHKAGWLIEKYRLPVYPVGKPRRAITEAAVVAELQVMIEDSEKKRDLIIISEAPPTNITGGMDSVEYVRRIRNGEDLP